jgi:hypothetical protein
LILNSVEFKSAIPSSGFDASAFSGDLRNVFYSQDPAKGTPGAYVKSNIFSPAWTSVL